MRLAKEVNMLRAIQAVWSERGGAASISFDTVIDRASRTGHEYSPQELASFLGTIPCVRYWDRAISWVNLDCLEREIHKP